MTPCEKLGYKVGDRFIAQIDGKSAKKGDILTLVRDDGSRIPLFQYETTGKNGYEYIEKYDDMYPGATWVLPAHLNPSTIKDPIEYLKSAHADGDMIDPATMLRECYGITKTERVVVEWSDVKKREIKVGDKVRLLRGGEVVPLLGFTNGEVYKVKNITNCKHRGTRLELDSCGYTSPNDVEPV